MCWSSSGRVRPLPPRPLVFFVPPRTACVTLQNGGPSVLAPPHNGLHVGVAVPDAAASVQRHRVRPAPAEASGGAVASPTMSGEHHTAAGESWAHPADRSGTGDGESSKKLKINFLLCSEEDQSRRRDSAPSAPANDGSRGGQSNGHLETGDRLKERDGEDRTHRAVVHDAGDVSRVWRPTSAAASTGEDDGGRRWPPPLQLPLPLLGRSMTSGLSSLPPLRTADYGPWRGGRQDGAARHPVPLPPLVHPPLSSLASLGGRKEHTVPVRRRSTSPHRVPVASGKNKLQLPPLQLPPRALVLRAASTEGGALTGTDVPRQRSIVSVVGRFDRTTSWPRASGLAADTSLPPSSTSLYPAASKGLQHTVQGRLPPLQPRSTAVLSLSALHQPHLHAPLLPCFKQEDPVALRPEASVVQSHKPQSPTEQLLQRPRPDGDDGKAATEPRLTDGPASPFAANARHEPAAPAAATPVHPIPPLRAVLFPSDNPELDQVRGVGNWAFCLVAPVSCVWRICREAEAA